MSDKQEKCYCDRMGIGVPGVSCGDCPARDYKLPRTPESERIAALERKVEALRKDAERYRWLRDPNNRRARCAHHRLYLFRDKPQ